MKKHNKKIRTRKPSSTGQLSIFAILIFQFLFVIFAVSLNLALVVHDKINLQNSVDIAAYYGAMKQAEMMNVIGHINYQIRQSWKLMAWRYYILGNMSVIKSLADADTRGWPESDVIEGGHPTPPFLVCVGHRYWGEFISTNRQVTSDSVCIDIGYNIPPIPSISIHSVSGGFSSFLHGIAALPGIANHNASETCNAYGADAWLLGASSIAHFRLDQSVRKYMILKLAQKLQAGKDIDNQDIKAGVENTFRKNLSYINKAADLRVKNALKDTNPGQWLADEPVTIKGLYGYSRSPPSACAKSLEWLETIHPWIGTPPPTEAVQIQQLVANTNQPAWPNSCTSPIMCGASAGIYKKDFTVYYGVKAELDYKGQIFLPFNRGLTLKAQAFAKPFGGRIGPQPNVDKLVPKSGSGDVPDAGPNYARYPGDEYGMRSRAVFFYWANLLSNAPKPTKQTINYMFEDHADDPLAWDPGAVDGTATVARNWEILAIAPDLFDITYHTILPGYQETYFNRVKQLVSGGPLPPDQVRGDLNYTKRGSGPVRGVWHQVDHRIGSLADTAFYRVPIGQHSLLLTGWVPPENLVPRLWDYTDSSGSGIKYKFGKCNNKIQTASSVGFWSVRPRPGGGTLKVPDGRSANACVAGGRAGYSVKLFSRDLLGRLPGTSLPW